MRLKYHKQLWELWRHFYDIKIDFEEGEIYKESEEKYFQYQKGRYEKAMLAYPTIVMLEHVTAKRYQRTEVLDPYYGITKEQMNTAFDICMEQTNQSIKNMKDLFKIPSRITNEPMERVQQIKSVRKSIKSMEKRIEAIEWYKGLVLNSDTLEAKFREMQAENLKYKK